MPHICIIKRGQKVFRKKKRGVSSAGSEHLPYKQGVTGSNPVRPTKGQLQSCPFFMSILFVRTPAHSLFPHSFTAALLRQRRDESISILLR